MHRKPLRSAFDVLTAGLFAAATTVPLVMMAFKTEGPNPALENRLPAAKPAWPADRASLAAFPQAFEKYFNDFFGFRQQLNRMHAVVWYRWLNMSPNSIVTVGKDRSLFVFPELDDYRRERPLSHEVLAWKAMILQQRHDWLAARGIKYLVVIIPNKATVFPELVPDSVKPLHPQGPAEQLRERLVEHTTVPVLDLTPALLAEKSKRLTFPRLDAHWNHYGAYVGYRATVERLAEWFPEMKPIPQEQCVIEEKDSPGDLGYLIGFPDVTEMRTFMRPAVSRAKGLETWGGRINQTLTSKVDDPGLPRAVIFHDSFMTGEKQFLSEHFSEARFRWIYTDFDAAAIAEVKPHVVIQQMIERSFSGPRGLAGNPPELMSPPSGPSAAPPLAAGQGGTEKR
jgi:hypothetical protein